MPVRTRFIRSPSPCRRQRRIVPVDETGFITLARHRAARFRSRTCRPLARRLRPASSTMVIREVDLRPIFGVSAHSCEKVDPHHPMAIPRSVSEEPPIRLHEKTMALHVVHAAGEGVDGTRQFNARATSCGPSEAAPSIEKPPGRPSFMRTSTATLGL